MGLLSLFGDESKGYKKEMQEFQKYYQEGKGRLQPYGDAGQRALGNLETGVNKMQDPSAFYNDIMGGYEQSPGYKYQLDEAQNMLNNNAAANGLLNSDTLKQALMQKGMGLLSMDRGQYFNDIMGINKDYLNQNSSIANLGYGADVNMANNAMTQGQQMGGAKLAQDQSHSAALQKLLGTIMNGAGNAFGGYQNGGGFGGAAQAVVRPYTSQGQAELSWLRNNGTQYNPNESYGSSY